MSTESPFLRLRVSREMSAAIAKAARRNKTTASDFVRRAIAAAVGNPDLATMREPGRPEKTKGE